MGRVKEMDLAANVSERRARIRRALICVFLCATIFLALVSTCVLFGIRFNVSESLPGLIYIVTSDTSSPLVEFCPVGSFAELSKERGYRRRGICPDGASPMLKPIVAHAGDTVEVSAHGIAVNGILLHNTAPRTRDTQGRILTPWGFGRYHVTPGFVWVASQYNPLSFDSRYFGPILVSQIRHHLRPL